MICSCSWEKLLCKNIGKLPRKTSLLEFCYNKVDYISMFHCFQKMTNSYFPGKLSLKSLKTVTVKTLISSQLSQYTITINGYLYHIYESYIMVSNLSHLFHICNSLHISINQSFLPRWCYSTVWYNVHSFRIYFSLKYCLVSMFFKPILRQW